MTEVFSRVSPSPVAAASLGQVYRGTLRPEYGGGEAAIKVRRPGCLESVGLDLYLMRQAGLYLRKVPEVRQAGVGAAARFPFVVSASHVILLSIRDWAPACPSAADHIPEAVKLFSCPVQVPPWAGSSARGGWDFRALPRTCDTCDTAAAAGCLPCVGQVGLGGHHRPLGRGLLQRDGL